MSPEENLRQEMPPNPPWPKLRLRLLLLGVCSVKLILNGATASGGIAGSPLTPAAGPHGNTMFVQLPPRETGVQTENRYADPAMWGDLYQEFLFGAIGTGVAIGDYDGDGRPDLFVVSKTESCRLFRNLGNWKFEDVTEKAGVADQGAAALVWKQGVTFADVNNDGWLDIYVCRFNAPNLLYVNQRNGTFKESARALGLDIVDSSGMAAFCDYDRDGWLDVFIATNLRDNIKHPNGQRGHLLHNRGGGHYEDVTDRSGIGGESQSHSATWWDYDNDGWPDLYVANDFGAPDPLYQNNRNGTFTNRVNQVVPHTAFSAMGSDLGDINNDGLLDFFVGDMAATNHQKDQRGPADLRGRDLKPPDGAMVTSKYHRNALLLNTGTGRVLEAAYLTGLAATDWTWSVRLEDLDNDGRLDLHVCTGMNKEENVDVNARMMTAESSTERIRIMHASPRLNEANLAFRNRGDLEFENVSAAWGLDQKGVSFGAAFGDLDGDGDLDLVYSNYEAGVTVLRNEATTGHRAMLDLRGNASNRFGIGAVVRLESASGVQVRQLSLARGYMSSSEPAVHFGLGADTEISRLTVSWPSGHTQIFENLPVGHRFSITEPSSPAPALSSGLAPTPGQFTEVGQTAGLSVESREEPTGESTQQGLLPASYNRRGPGLAVGDLDGDGADSICLGGTTRDPARVLHRAPGTKSRTVAVSSLAPGAPTNDGPLLLFDAKCDGTTSLLLTKGGSNQPAGAAEYQPTLFFNDGRGVLRPAPEGALPPLRICAGTMAAADFDHDGRLDVFLGGRVSPGQYPLAPQSALLANRGGKFDDVTNTVAPGLRTIGMVTAALWSDVDGDGWPDLLLTLEWGQVKYFHNNGGRIFEDRTEAAGFASAGAGWWTSLAGADFNGDSTPDFVVGNTGLNTPYRASPQQPALLFSGDFSGGGRAQPVEAYYEGDRLYPRRSRRELGVAIPSILKRFPRNDFYARATLKEVLGEDKLAAAQRFVATELRSGVFLSQPGGTHRFEPLPRIAQLAPIQGMVAGDFDGDGHADIYAVQNSYAPIPAVGRFDGGLSQMLRGDGRGNFVPVPPAESQLLVPGDAKALAMLDLDQDGWPDFFVSRNNSSTLAFRNNGVAGRNSVCVRLRGPAGNPTGIGARISVTLKDNSVQTAEVYAGSGYYSQSVAACFFGFADGNPPTKYRVRWPGGSTTEHVASTPESTLILSAPGS